MKYIADVLTVSRIVMSIDLLFFEPFTAVFFTLYVLCGVSDMLDGFVARRLGTFGSHGDRLDSIADVVFAAFLIVTVLPKIDFAPWVYVCVSAVAAIKLASLLVSRVKFGKVRFLHTYLNKLAGLCCFALPVLLCTAGKTLAAALVCAVCFAAAVNELFLNVTGKIVKTDY